MNRAAFLVVGLVALLALLHVAEASPTRFVGNNRIRVVAESEEQWELVKSIDAIFDHQSRSDLLEAVLYATDQQKQFLVEKGLVVEDATEVIEDETLEFSTRSNADDYTSSSYWKTHHNYDALTKFLENINRDFPTITDLISVGQTVQGRQLWVLEISNNPGVREEGEPFFKYIGNMHGDEVSILSSLSSSKTKHSDSSSSSSKKKRLWEGRC